MQRSPFELSNTSEISTYFLGGVFGWGGWPCLHLLSVINEEAIKCLFSYLHLLKSIASFFKKSVLSESPPDTAYYQRYQSLCFCSAATPPPTHLWWLTWNFLKPKLRYKRNTHAHTHITRTPQHSGCSNWIRFVVADLGFRFDFSNVSFNFCGNCFDKTS